MSAKYIKNILCIIFKIWKYNTIFLTSPTSLLRIVFRMILYHWIQITYITAEHCFKFDVSNYGWKMEILKIFAYQGQIQTAQYFYLESPNKLTAFPKDLVIYSRQTLVRSQNLLSPKPDELSPFYTHNPCIAFQ